MNILVTGGAGYIGSVTVLKLLEKGYKVTIIDKLINGNKYKKIGNETFYKGDLLDTGFIANVFKEQPIDGVIHFAASLSVEESMHNPGIYFENNIQGTVNLLEAMKQHKVNTIIFSSSSGVYGNTGESLLRETMLPKPENPYAESKKIVEEILFWYKKIFDLQFVSLRYFNAAGATLDGRFGEHHVPEPHIIPRALFAALHDEAFFLYGNDYPTKDGTCIRDYIHVLDLSGAHIRLLEALFEKKQLKNIYNVGTGKGYSNLDIVTMIKNLTGKNIKIEIKPRRMGDAAILVADTTAITHDLEFRPKYSDLQTILKSAWKWQRKLG